MDKKKFSGLVGFFICAGAIGNMMVGQPGARRPVQTTLSPGAYTMSSTNSELGLASAEGSPPAYGLGTASPSVPQNRLNSSPYYQTSGTVADSNPGAVSIRAIDPYDFAEPRAVNPGLQPFDVQSSRGTIGLTPDPVAGVLTGTNGRAYIDQGNGVSDAQTGEFIPRE